jgi:hypothetical protein
VDKHFHHFIKTKKGNKGKEQKWLTFNYKSIIISLVVSVPVEDVC